MFSLNNLKSFDGKKAFLDIGDVIAIFNLGEFFFLRVFSEKNINSKSSFLIFSDGKYKESIDLTKEVAAIPKKTDERLKAFYNLILDNIPKRLLMRDNLLLLISAMEDETKSAKIVKYCFQITTKDLV